MLSTFTTMDLYLLSPMILLFIFSLVPVFTKVLNKNNEPSDMMSLYLPLIGIVFAFIATCGIILIKIVNGAPKLIFSGSIMVDGLAMWSVIIVLFITFFALVLIKESSFTPKHLFSEYVMLMLNAAVGMMVVAYSNDFILTFIGIEMASLCLYMLIAMSEETRLSKEAAIKYFVLGSLASAILLYGIAFIFGTTGTTQFAEITETAATLASTSRLFLVGCVLVFVGLGFKVSIFPFHFWTPDVYQGSSSPLTAFMAAGIKAVCFAALLRFFATGFLAVDRASGLVSTIQWLAVMSMMLGNIAALRQNHLKRILAYSSIAHSGYLLMGLLVVGLSTNSVLGASGTLFYLFSYAIMTIGAFGFLSLFEKSENSMVTVDHLKGLAYRRPYLALVISIFMLSLAGIPPLLGFFSKFYIFSAAMKQGLYWLVIWGVVSSVISVYFYLKPVVYMYMKQEDEALVGEFKDSASVSFTVGVSAALIVIVGLSSGPLYALIRGSVLSLF
ncbi:MAG: NADH-quinone oxidoreductase subunit N [Bdellovibrionaceae bacterium]|jgi:NADH-quinone oxidoreductase subunit N|nr:NADH-quinone oxidoreductase subunit N [Pseudobdellovibrionaceae bacterium]